MKKDVLMLNYIIYIFLLFYLAVDTVAGILIKRGLPNIGLAYKGLLLVLMILVAMLYNWKNSVYIFAGISILFFCALFWTFIPMADFSQSFMTLFKILSVVFTFLYLIRMDEPDKLRRIILANYCIFLFNMLAGALGYGNSSYSYDDAGVGVKGFFYAGNEVTYTFICLTFLVFYTAKHYKKILYFISILISFVIGTKTGMLSIFMLVFIDIYYSEKSKAKRRLIIFTGIILLLLVVLAIVFLFSQIPLFRLIVFKFNQHKRGTLPILNALLSGRIERIPEIINIYNSNWSLKTFLLGLGFPSVSVMKRIEMDFFELYFYYGLIILSLVVLFYVYLFMLASKHNNKKLIAFNLICLMISFLAGHVLYSMMGGVFFCLCNCDLESVETFKGSSNLRRINRIIFKVQ